jgi:predicted signal transduction protein with EAL and GGDEF domain
MSMIELLGDAGLGRSVMPDMIGPKLRRDKLAAELRLDLKDVRGLSVVYQPIVDIRTGRVASFEALVRWRMTSGTWIEPAEFVPLAEEYGLIDQLGEFVLLTACSDAARWRHSIAVAVNISALQTGRDTLLPLVNRALAASGLSPKRLHLELTETALVHDEGRVAADLRRLHALGTRIALDDFGTGFSSFAHLRAFPFDKIKIEGSFVRNAIEQPDCAAIVAAIAFLGRRLGVTTVAEGIETHEQLALVTEEGCSEGQGYLLGHPASTGCLDTNFAGTQHLLKVLHSD